MNTFLYVIFWLVFAAVYIGDMQHVNAGKEACLAQSGYPVIIKHVIAFDDVICTHPK